MSKQSEMGEELLPWYVNNTLSDSEKAKLDLLCANSKSFSKKVQEERKLADRLLQEDVELDEVLQKKAEALTLLRQRIRSETPMGEPPTEVKSNTSAEQEGKKSNKLRSNIIKFPAPLAMAASILLVSFVSFWFLPSADLGSDSSDFEVFTTPADGGLIMQLVFSPNATGNETQGLLQSTDIEVLSGPSANGVYRVRLQNENDLLYWQQLDEVIWAEIEVK